MRPSPRLLPALLTALVAVVGVLVTLLFLQRGYLPPETRDGIQSGTAVAGRSPYTVHVAFAVGLFVTIVLTLLRARIERLFSTSHSLARVIFVGVVVVWVLSSAQCYQGASFGLGGDPFHEGEYFGFRQTYLEGGLGSCLVIHGPLPNILPGALAGPYREDGYSIAITRLCRSLFGLASMVGLVWVLWELVQYYSTQPAGPIFRLLVLAAIALEGLLYLNTSWTIMGPFRDAAFYVSLALLLRWLRPDQLSPIRDLVYGLLLGVLTVAGLLVSYERGLSWPIVFGFGAVLGTVSRGVSGIRFAAGGVIGAAATAGALGQGVLTEVMAQAAYWAKYGDVMFAEAPDLWALLYSPYFLGQLLVIFGTLSWALRDFACRQTSFREWIRELAPVLALLLVAGLTERRVLARGDTPHYQMAGMPAVLTLAALLLLIVRRQIDDSRPGWLATTSIQVDRTAVMATVVTLLVLTHPNCFPLAPAVYVADWAPNHSKVQDQTRDITAAVSRFGPLGPGEFYTLDSAGVWYYLTSTSSPSRFHQVVYAMPAVSQQQVVEDLERHKTRVILVPPEKYRFDGVALETMFPIIQGYLDAHYAQAAVVHDYRIFIRKP